MDNEEVFAEFLRDCPTEIWVMLDVRGFSQNVDAISLKRFHQHPDNKFSLAVRYKDEWFQDEIICNQTQDEWSMVPHARNQIEKLCEKVVNKIAQTERRAAL